jgi:hypothetical protein
MKLILSLFAFALTLALTHGAVAGEENTSEKMNALFPKKQPNPSMSIVPAKAELSEPAYFAKISGDRVTLKWKAVEGADQYHLQVATDPNFKWLKADEQTLTTTSFDVAQLEPGAHYYWRVQAVKSNNEPTFRKSFFAMSMFETATK